MQHTKIHRRATFPLQVLCKVVSIVLHYLFTTCFMFMLLEALHMYVMVAFVVKRNGFFSKIQNIIVGYGVPLAMVGISAGAEWNSYGGEYQWVAKV